MMTLDGVPRKEKRGKWKMMGEMVKYYESLSKSVRGSHGGG